MNAQNKINFIHRWDACKASAQTHPYVRWIATVSPSVECKELHDMIWRVDSEDFAQAATLHMARKDGKCACRITPISKLPDNSKG